MLPACIAEFMQYGRFTGLESITATSIRSFYDHLHVRPLKRKVGGLSAMMISHYVYALKVFFEWQEVSGLLDHNPMSGLKFRRAAASSRDPLTVAEVQSLFGAAMCPKEQVMLHLFYSCGLRRSEAAALGVKDVHVKPRLLYVRSGKGAKRRVIPLTQKVADILGSYLEGERNSSSSSSRSFMLNQKGNRMSGSSYNLLLKSLLPKAGLPNGITLHHLRHSIATHLLQGGMSLEYVRDFLGHTHLEATQLYAKISRH